MSRRDFIALAWPCQAHDASGRAQTLATRLQAEGGWRRAGATERLIVWTRAAAPLPVHALPGGGGFVVGDLFPMPGAPAQRAVFDDPRIGFGPPGETAHHLSRAFWGRYAALIHGPSGGGVSVYRDPSGLLECMTWSLGDGVDVITSDLLETPVWLRPPRAFLNWDRIALAVAAPSVATTPSLLDDIEVVGPGERLEICDGPRGREAIWTPAGHAGVTRADLGEIEDEVVRRVDLCTSALVRGHDRVIVELSGGLDSSILAGAVGATGLSAKVAQWVNYLDQHPGADERAFARSVTERLGVELTIARKSPAALTEADLAELGPQFRPAIGGADAHRDREEAQRLRQAGATAILSGQGGDGAFFQFPSPLVVADEVRRRGWSTLSWPIVADVARRTHQSVWNILRDVRAALRGADLRPSPVSALLTPQTRAFAEGAEHEWVREARNRGLPPGKVLHVQGIAVTHVYGGPSRRLQQADILLPLFAQPVLELCLSIPTPDLAGGSYDRPFARNAFAARLPPAVLNRRTKGALSGYFAQLVANSLDTLRPYLLDGCLCDAGVLDRALLDQVLDPQQLIGAHGLAATDVLTAATAEAWVRHWQGRTPDSLQAGRHRDRRPA
jgi:asparagine synthase (glutamine-hydrolysing)